jgi:hypothetical protein
MKTQVLLSFCLSALLCTCGWPEDQVIPYHLPLNESLVHFDIYIELLPDTTLNADEQSHQAYALRLMTRRGYAITIYQKDSSIHGESVIRRGVSNHVGNYRAIDLPYATYRIEVSDSKGVMQEIVVTPAKKKLTMLTFSFHVPA